jgi:Fur family transcriptional regulator, peroxide stress response regulator
MMLPQNSEPIPGPTGQNDLRRALEHAGWRFTRQRAAVYKHLCAAATHPTAEQIFVSVRGQMPNISLATVYKALEALVDAGMATRLGDGTGPARYDGRGEAHYHFRCERTGEIIDLPLAYDPHLLEKLGPHVLETLRQNGFEVVAHRLELVGRLRPRSAVTGLTSVESPGPA